MGILKLLSINDTSNHIEVMLSILFELKNLGNIGTERAKMESVEV